VVQNFSKVLIIGFISFNLSSIVDSNVFVQHFSSTFAAFSSTLLMLYWCKMKWLPAPTPYWVAQSCLWMLHKWANKWFSRFSWCIFHGTMLWFLTASNFSGLFSNLYFYWTTVNFSQPQSISLIIFEILLYLLESFKTDTQLNRLMIFLRI